MYWPGWYTRSAFLTGKDGGYSSQGFLSRKAQKALPDKISAYGRLIWLIILLLVSPICAGSTAHAGMCLELRNLSKNRTISCWPIEPGERFSFMYVHSVQKTPVFEDYVLDQKGQVLLVETRVQSFGYGMPKPKQGDDYELIDGFFVIRFKDRQLGRLLIRVNFVRVMTISLRDKSLDLRDVGQGGDLIQIQGLTAR
ncbi:MAG: DUF1850 domain-containing protein [Desulfarculaceae bacterium]